MTRFYRKRLSWGIPALLFGLAFHGVVPELQAQADSTTGPTTSSTGPTREAGAATARTVLDAERATPRLMPGYLAFQRDFTRDFGGAPRVSDRLSEVLGLKARLEQRWGDTSVYEWIERGLAAYGWIRASTRTERRGFDIRVDTGDMAEGKLGVHMSRPLGNATAE
jgi:hypothetical protein